MHKPVGRMDPEFCWHPRARRLGRVSLPFPPYRICLLNRVVCLRTITTGTLREKRRSLDSRLSQARVAENKSSSHRTRSGRLPSTGVKLPPHPYSPRSNLPLSTALRVDVRSPSREGS